VRLFESPDSLLRLRWASSTHPAKSGNLQDSGDLCCPMSAAIPTGLHASPNCAMMHSFAEKASGSMGRDQPRSHRTQALQCFRPWRYFCPTGAMESGNRRRCP